MDNFSFFEYEVRYWDEVDEEAVTRRGVTCGQTYAEAMSHIEESYGSDTIINLSNLEAVDCTCYEVDYNSPDAYLSNN